MSEMNDAEKLRMIASLFDDYNMNLPITRKKVQDDLRRIADDLERKAVSDEENLTPDHREAREYLRANGIDPDVSANKILSKLVSEFVRRAAHWKERAEAAEALMNCMDGKEMDVLDKQWQALKAKDK